MVHIISCPFTGWKQKVMTNFDAEDKAVRTSAFLKAGWGAR